MGETFNRLIATSVNSESKVDQYGEINYENRRSSEYLYTDSIGEYLWQVIYR